MPQRLRLGADNTFTIAQFTDIHWGGTSEVDYRSRSLMTTLLHLERPDLVIFTGDVISSYLCSDPIQSFRDAVAVVEENHIPWAVTFGNHDSEMFVTRPELMKLILEHASTVMEAGPADINGTGNCTIEIVDNNSLVRYVLYLFDSGNLSELPSVKGYDWIHTDQVAWYRKTSNEYRRANGDRPIPSLAFFHIPLPEYDDVWENETCYGNKNEGVCCPSINSGLFTAMVEMGDVMGTFAGHDHTNDYSGTLCGIRLCYGRSTGYGGYGSDDLMRGCRMIRVKLDSDSFESWIRLEDATVIATPPQHLPDGTPGSSSDTLS